MRHSRAPSFASASALQALRLTLLAAVGVPLGCGKTSHDEASGTDSGGSNANNSDGTGGSLGPGGSGFATVGGGGNGVTTTAGPITTVGSTGNVTPVGLCSDPTERLAAGMPSGFIQCAEGYEVREREVACPNLLPPKGQGGMAGM